MPEETAAPLNEYYHPSLFNWFIGIIVIATGISYLLFTASSPTPAITPYLLTVKILKVASILIGLGLVVFGSNEADESKKDKLFYAGIGILSAALSGIFYLSGDYGSASGHAVLSALLILYVFISFSDLSKMLLLTNLWGILLSVVFVLKPSFLEFAPMIVWARDNQFYFGVILAVYSSINLAASWLSLRGNKRALYATTILTSLAAFIVCVLTVSDGIKDVGTASAILGVFALSFPVWLNIEPLGRLSVLKFINAFSWLFMIVILGTVLSLYIQNTFVKFLSEDMTSREIHATKVLDRYLSERKLSVEGFQSNPQLLSLAAASKQNPAEIEAQLKELYLISRKFLRVVYINPEGKIVASYPVNPSIIGTDVSSLTYYRQARNDSQVAVSDIIAPETPNALPLVAVSGQLSKTSNTASGKTTEKPVVLGVISGWIDMYDLNEALANQKYNDQTTFTLANTSEVVINDIVTNVTNDKSQIPVIRVVGKVPSVNWTLTLEQPLQQVKTNYMAVTSAIFLISMLSGISSIFIMLYIEKREKQVI